MPAEQGGTMYRTVLLIAAIAACSASFFVAGKVNAADCAVIVAEGRGVDQAHASARALKHLTFKINRWAHKKGLSTVRSGDQSNVCTSKTAFVHCVASRKVCG
jgi:hypothetical protein